MLNARGMTILLTTHYLEEAQELCDNIAIINHGRIIVDEDKKTVMRRVDAKEIRITVDRDIDAVPPTLSNFQTDISEGRIIRVKYSSKQVNAGQILSAVQGAGLGVIDVSTTEADLEDVFLQLTKAA